MIFIIVGFIVYVLVVGILWYYVLKMMKKEERLDRDENNKENI